MTKRIALMATSLEIGGVQSVTVTNARILSNAGYDVDVLLARKSGPLIAQMPKSVRIIDLSAKRTIAALPALVRYIRAAAPDLLLPATAQYNVLCLLAVTLCRSNAKVITGTHSDPHVEFGSHRLKRPVMLFAARALYPRAAAHMSVSRESGRSLEILARLPSGSVRTIYNAIDLEPVSAGQASTHPWLDCKKGRVVISAGRLSPEKDHETLICAFQSVVRDLPDVRLVIFGDGPSRTKLQDLVAKLGLSGTVDLPGFTHQIRADMAAADLFVLPSRVEGFGNVIVEALAEGTPVISTDCDFGPREILDKEFLVPVGDADQMAKRICAAFANPQKIDRTNIQRFGLPVIAREIIDLVASV